MVGKGPVFLSSLGHERIIIFIVFLRFSDEVDDDGDEDDGEHSNDVSVPRFPHHHGKKKMKNKQPGGKKDDGGKRLHVGRDN